MKLINWLYSHPFKFALIIFFCLSLFYASSIPNFNVGYADSDEFLSIAQNWGLAHPPGYSLYVTVLHLFMHLPLPFTTPAFRGHLLSALSTATAIGLALPLLLLIYKHLVPQKNRNPSLFVFASLIVLLATATSKQLWLYSQITEKYVFSGPLIVLMLLIGVKIILNPKSKNIYFAFFGLIFGALIGHHQSMIFLVPYFIVTLISSLKSSKKPVTSIGSSILGICLGIGFSVLLLFIQISRQAAVPVTWFTRPGVNGVIDMITRADFRGELYAQNITTNGYIPANLNLNQFLTGSLKYFQNYGQSYNWWILLPLIAAVLIIVKSKKTPLIWSLTLVPLFLGPLLLGYLGWPQDLGSQAITERFFLPSYLVFMPLLFIGLLEIFRRLNMVLQILHIKPNTKLLVIGLIPLGLIIQIAILYPHISLKHFDLVSRLYSNSLNEVKPNSLVTCYSDTSCFALLYEQTVNHLRPDVDIVPLAYPLVSKNIKDKHLQRFTYEDNPYLIFDIVTHNLNQRPVYAIDMNRYYFSLFGISNAFMFSVPDGYKSELTRHMPNILPAYDYQITNDYLQKQYPSFDKYRLFMVESLVQAHISNSYTYLIRGERARAQAELNTAVNLAHLLSPTQTKNIEAIRGSVESAQIDPRFSPGSSVIDTDLLFESIPELISQSKNAQVYKTYLAIITIDPENLPARIELARIYKKYNDLNFARLEYQNVLVIDPTNQEAIDYLK